MAFKVLQILTVVLMVVLNCFILKSNIRIINILNSPDLSVINCDLISVYDDGVSEETWED